MSRASRAFRTTLICLQTRCSFTHTHYLAMRKTLRRSCDACARSKLRCDLLTPQCSRCRKTTRACVYANEPLSSPPTEDHIEQYAKTSSEPIMVATRTLSTSNILVHNPGIQSFDPFKTYPQTRLLPAQVERLIQHCESDFEQNTYTRYIANLYQSFRI
jgi:hypothetical protein